MDPTPLPKENLTNGPENSQQSSTEVIDINDSNADGKSSNNSTQFEAVSGKNSKLSASE